MIFQFRLFAPVAATVLRIECFLPEWNYALSLLPRWPRRGLPRISRADRMFEQDAAGFNVNSAMS